MIPTLYPKVVVKTALQSKVPTERVISTLYPVVVAKLSSRPQVVIHRSIATLYPPVLVRTSKNIVSVNDDFLAQVVFLGPKICHIPPPINDFIMLNDGQEGFVSPFGNAFIASYVSDGQPTDIIGNYSYDGINWNPASNNTDPPSHFVEAIKDLPDNCVFYPFFNEYDNGFCFAWLENTPFGRLNLKYANVPIPNPPILPSSNTTFVPPVKHSQEIYIRPQVAGVDSNAKTQNIPLSDIKVVDQSGNSISLDSFYVSDLRGYQLELPDVIKSVNFTQYFRQSGTIECFLGSAPQAGNSKTNYIAPVPLSNFTVNIYYGKTVFKLYNSYQTDVNGVFQANIKPGNYTFEILISTPSIHFEQKLL